MWFAYQPTEDGRIVPCRVAEDGAFSVIPGAAVKTDPLSVALTSHPSGKFLYASTRLLYERDGWDAATPNSRTALRKKSFVYVYRVAPDGRLSRAQRILVNGVLVKTAMYPDGKRLFAGLPDHRYLLFDIRSDGTLSAPRPFSDFPTFTLERGADTWGMTDLALSPDGKAGYLYIWQLVKGRSQASLQPLRIAHDGSLKRESDRWEIHDSDPPSPSIRRAPGPITYSPDGTFAVIGGDSNELWHCPLDAAGRIREDKSVRYPLRGPESETPSPFFHRQRSGEWRIYGLIRQGNGNVLYHLFAPGKFEQTATFGTGGYCGYVSTRNGHLLYETYGVYDDERKRYVNGKMTAFRLDDAGRVTPASGFRRLFAYDEDAALLFLNRP